MSIKLALWAAAVWFAIAVLAVANGMLRETVLVPVIGHDLALPLSGLMLSLLVFVATWIAFPLFGQRHARAYLAIGLQWVAMTLAFEFVLGRFVQAKNWEQILQIFHISAGNLFVLVLISSLLSPLLVARMKGVV